MSEYQVYEFQTIDRALTAEERSELNTWSSRSKASSHKIKFTYSYGDFSRNTESVMFQYFDAMSYWANYGVKEIIFRFPKDTINKKAIIPYTFSENIELRSKGDYVLLIFRENVEDGGYEEWWDDDETVLSDLIGLRQAIMEGDYRALYLAWLYFHSPNSKAPFDVDYYDEEEDDSFDYDGDEVMAAKMRAVEPPMPAGLGDLSADLQIFASFWGLSEDWIKAAALASKPKQSAALDLPKLIANLSAAEKEEFLVRLAKQEPNLGQILLKKLEGFRTKELEEEGAKPRKMEEIAELADNIMNQRIASEKAASEAKKLVELNRIHNAKDIYWRGVERDLALKSGKGYDEAVEMLQKLSQVAEVFGEKSEFIATYQRVLSDYKSSLALKKRISAAGLPTNY
ncbi:MAG: hypothetical protein ACKVTZ_17855 [Bacteroidia bacterium]